MIAVSIAASGIQGAFRRADASAARTVQFGGAGDVDLGREAVEQITAEAELKANVAVARTADAMLGVLLDLKA